MSKRRDKRIDHAAVAFATTILFAACSQDAAREADSLKSSQRQDATGTAADDNTTRHAAIERRHFDIYDHYRKLSDQRNVGVRVRDDEGMRPVLTRVSDLGIDLMPACSMRAMLAGD